MKVERKTRTRKTAEDSKPVSKGSQRWKTFSKHIMTGISYMIPVLIMGGLIGAIALIIPYVIMGVDPAMGIKSAMNSGLYSGGQIRMLQISDVMSNFGFTLFGFAIPLFAAFTANSIGGKTALVAGFIGGYLANKPIGVANLIDGQWEAVSRIPSGFLGAILIAFIIGYFVKWLNKVINLPQKYLAFKATFLLPLLSATFCMVMMVFVITPFGGMINQGIRSVLEAAGQSGELVYAALLSGATAFDLGGPVNKAAGFVALGFTLEKTLPITARCIAIVVPSFGLGLSTLIDRKLVGRRVYDKQFYELGKTAIFLGFMGISEGSIPFALERPSFTIPLYVAGGILGGVSAVLLGAVQWFPESAIWAWPLIENIGSYVLALAIGSTFIAVINVLHRNKLIKQGKLTVE